MRSATQVIREVIEGMQLDIYIRGAEILDGSYKFYADYTYYLAPGLIITIGGNEYTIEEISIDNYFICTGDAGLGVGTYTIRNPYFNHGKYLQYVAEFRNKFNGAAAAVEYESAPFVYNVETQPRTQPTEKDSIIDSEGDMRFIIYNSEKVNERSIEETTTDILQPLHRWIDEFEKALEASYSIHDIGTVVRTDHRLITTNGDETDSDRGETLFNGQYSGVEFIMNVQIKINLDCPVRDLPPLPEGDAYSDGYSDGYA